MNRTKSVLSSNWSTQGRIKLFERGGGVKLQIKLWWGGEPSETCDLEGGAILQYYFNFLLWIYLWASSLCTMYNKNKKVREFSNIFSRTFKISQKSNFFRYNFL